MTALLLMFALGCAKDPAPVETPAADNPTETPAPETPAPDKGGDRARTEEGGAAGDKGGAGGDAGSDKAAPPNFGGNVNVSADPMAAYEKYRDRLEGQEAAGECASDSDCAPAGCSKEVCAPAGSEINTTCEVLPVYTVLDACGCVETKCQWSIKQ